jgi:hypothetical protein
VQYRYTSSIYKVPLSVESNKGGRFLEAIACNCEDPMQSVSVTARISNYQLQSSDEAYLHTTILEQKSKFFSLTSSTRITPGGDWAVGLQVPSLKRPLSYQDKYL